MNEAHLHGGGSGPAEGWGPWLPVFVLATLLYIAAAVRLGRRGYAPWPRYRSAMWCVGIWCAALAVVGPIAGLARVDFTAHMAGHLLLGMLTPLLIVFSAPVTLLYRVLPVRAGRRLSGILRSRLMQLASDPLTAGVLHIGGLWILYTTCLYALMHRAPIVHALVHLHVFLAGLAFTASMIAVDPMPHRRSFGYRAIVMVSALAGHGMLSKYIYAHPPLGVPILQAESGGMLMYYGGDVIDIALITLFCRQWYAAVRPRPDDRSYRATRGQPKSSET
jgi:putative membrane protein